MIEQLKLFYNNNRNIIRITRYIFLSLILLIITRFFDYQKPALKLNFPHILLLSPEVTSSFLSNLSGTFLTVSTFTFTTILTVLNKYSDSFTPRIVQDFIDKPNVLSLFGVFIGGFFYTVLSLFMIQNIDSDLPLISGTIGIFYAVATMISFILFVKRVLKDIKVGNIIENLYVHAAKLIDQESERRRLSERFSVDEWAQSYKIYANKSGYLYTINADKMINLIKDSKYEIIVNKRIGDYVLDNMYIGDFNVSQTLDREREEKLLKKISDNIIINVRKNDTRDYHHEITNIVEIALRALSPGINDPNTASEAIIKVGILLGKLFSSKNFYQILNEDDNSKIIYNNYSAKEELSLSYNQILHYGKDDPEVAKAILSSIFMIYHVSDQSVHEEIEQFFIYCYEECKGAMTSPAFIEPLDHIYQDFVLKRDELINRDSTEEEEDKGLLAFGLKK
ncbi:DUF2254 domain-containing protein [Facklamia languida]|uniref:DUF2254 domain-containing protein n=1 Tax=Facklamia languida CCUG 37842 TaxID=883113 RepID=H3NKM8_9LACT|nr:DUF2254 domain-containing protein [Facklamia languida]EHR36411.1 hypothetical protein HMPREF9708_01417 [Facklamia languida CCUG 37842]